MAHFRLCALQPAGPVKLPSRGRIRLAAIHLARSPRRGDAQEAIRFRHMHLPSGALVWEPQAAAKLTVHELTATPSETIAAGHSLALLRVSALGRDLPIRTFRAGVGDKALCSRSASRCPPAHDWHQAGRSARSPLPGRTPDLAPEDSCGVGRPSGSSLSLAAESRIPAMARFVTHTLRPGMLSRMPSHINATSAALLTVPSARSVPILPNGSSWPVSGRRLIG